VRLGDGRWIQIWAGGSPGGSSVLFLPGCPDTRHAASPGEQAALRADVRLVAVNRPGYGRSNSHASTHLSVADDVVAVADALRIDRFAVLGMSIGGPYALACAARHPARVTAVGVLASPANVPELDPPCHRDDLGPDEQAFFARLASMTPDEAVEHVRADFQQYVDRLNPTDPDDEALIRRFVAQLPPYDAEIAIRQGTTAAAAAVREALANPDGYLRDAAISFKRWDFHPEAITCPTFLWYGELDANASVRNGHWLAAHLPLATLVVRDRTTHLAVLHDHWDDVLSTLTGAN